MTLSETLATVAVTATLITAGATFLVNISRDRAIIAGSIESTLDVELTRLEIRQTLSQRRLSTPVFIPDQIRNSVLGNSNYVLEDWIPPEVRLFRPPGDTSNRLARLTSLIRDAYDPAFSILMPGPNPAQIVTIPENATTFSLSVSDASRWRESAGQLVSINTPDGSFIAIYNSRSGNLLNFSSSDPVNMGFFSRRVPLPLIRAGSFISPVRVLTVQPNRGAPGIELVIQSGSRQLRRVATGGEVRQFSFSRMNEGNRMPAYLTRNVMRVELRLEFKGANETMRNRDLRFEL